MAATKRTGRGGKRGGKVPRATKGGRKPPRKPPAREVPRGTSKRRGPPRDSSGRFVPSGPRKTPPRRKPPKISGGGPPPSPKRTPTYLYREERKRRERHVRRIRKAPATGAAQFRKHLERESEQAWSMTRAEPARFWTERFHFESAGPVYYEELLAALTSWEGDRVADRAMSGHTVSITVVVRDPERGRLWLRTGPTADWANAIDDAVDKVSQWAASYGADAKDEDASQIEEVIVKVGDELGGGEEDEE